MNVRVALCQVPCQPNLESAILDELAEYRPDIICLPEYCFTRHHTVHVDEAAYASENLKYVLDLSARFRCTVIGGSFVEKVNEGLYNHSYLVIHGKTVGHYAKINLYGRESAAGIQAGTEYRSFDVGSLRIGILICADVLNAESFKKMREHRCDMIFVPTTSPKKRETVEEKHGRDERLFVQGARTAGCYIVKCCAVGTLFGHPLQGRSLIASPGGIVQRASVEMEDSSFVMKSELPFDR
jgi:predicted amidohydrolase